MAVADNTVNYSLGIEFFQANSRLNRVEYLGWFSFWFSIILLGVITTHFLQSFPLSSHILVNLCLLFGLFHIFKVTIQRLHDFNWRGTWVIGLAVPIAGIVWFLIICFIPGTPNENRYGVSVATTQYDYLRLLATPIAGWLIYLM